MPITIDYIFSRGVIRNLPPDIAALSKLFLRYLHKSGSEVDAFNLIMHTGRKRHLQILHSRGTGETTIIFDTHYFLRYRKKETGNEIVYTITGAGYEQCPWFQGVSGVVTQSRARPSSLAQNMHELSRLRKKSRAVNVKIGCSIGVVGFECGFGIRNKEEYF